MIYYYAVCKRKLWYFIHEIQMEQDNDLVAIGKMIDEEAYQRNEKHMNIDNIINIDFIHAKNVLHEVKKSNKIEEASILQVKYYLYYLKMRGVNKTAVIDYPLLKQTVTVELTKEDEQKMEEIIKNIHEIENQKVPEMTLKKICKSCAYYDLCSI